MRLVYLCGAAALALFIVVFVSTHRAYARTSPLVVEAFSFVARRIGLTRRSRLSHHTSLLEFSQRPRQSRTTAVGCNLIHDTSH